MAVEKVGGQSDSSSALGRAGGRTQNGRCAVRDRQKGWWCDKLIRGSLASPDTVEVPGEIYFFCLLVSGWPLLGKKGIQLPLAPASSVRGEGFWGVIN